MISDRRKWIVLSVLIISLLAVVLDNTVLNIALKTISEPKVGLSASQSQLEWAINSYTLVFAGLLFTFGVVGDRIGRKRMLMYGMALFGLASLVSSYAQTPDELIWARAAMGLGGDAGSWVSRGVLGPTAGGLAVLVVFCVHESRTAHPSLDVRLFRDPRLSSAAAAIGLNFFAMAGVYFFMSFYLQNVRGYSPLHAGLLTTPVAIGQLVAASRSARLVRRYGAKVVAASGLLLVTGALVGYHSLSLHAPIVALELIFLIQGAGMGVVMPTATESVMSVVPRERGGAGSAITNTSRQVAVALGVAVLGSILAHTPAQPALAEE